MRILRLNWDFVVATQKSHDGSLAKRLVYACNVLDTWVPWAQYIQVNESVATGDSTAEPF
jgi:hypothetical protein